MRKIFPGILLCLMTMQTFAGLFDTGVDYTYAVSAYKPIYILTGFNEIEQLKLQMSLKYDLFYPYKTGFYLGYSQLMFWDIYNSSGPFREINFNPELFWRFESGNNFLGDLRLIPLDYLQLGVEHLSNGKDLDESRGWSSLYAQLQLSLGSFINFGVNYKYFWIFVGDGPHNMDIIDYIGNMEGIVFVKLIDPKTKADLEEIYVKFCFGNGIIPFDGGWQEIGLKSRTLFSRFRPFIYIYRGYAESIIEYNLSKADLGLPGNIAFKVGFIIQ